MTQRRVGPYGKLLANYAADDAIIAAGEAAELLFCRAIAFLSTSDSDGFITDSQLVRYVGAGMRDAKKRAEVLVREGLWLRVDGGYQMRSYLKINESAEEKGRKKRTDRERKRTPKDVGIQEDSERNPSGIRNMAGADSLTACISTVVTEEVQSKEVQSSAAIPPQAARGNDTAQTIVAEWCDRSSSRPPGRVVGQVAKLVGEMLAEGIDPDDVRRGIAAWMTKGLHPSTLPSVVNEVMNRATSPPINGKATAKATGWLNLPTGATA